MTLRVPPAAAAGVSTAVPTLDEWGVLALALLLAGLGAMFVRRRNAG